MTRRDESGARQIRSPKTTQLTLSEWKNLGGNLNQERHMHKRPQLINIRRFKFAKKEVVDPHYCVFGKRLFAPCFERGFAAKWNRALDLLDRANVRRRGCEKLSSRATAAPRPL